MEFNEENDEDNDSPQFLNFDNMSNSSKNDNKEIKVQSKLSLRMKIIIFSIIFIIIIILIILIIYKLLQPKECEPGHFLPDDSKSKCMKCTIQNCDKCFGTKESNTCSSCILNYFPFYENNILKSCNPCNEGCLSCDEEKNKCSKCYDGYKLENGMCILNYSFKAVYFVKSMKENVTLINYKYKDKIKEILIDGNNPAEINNSYWLEYGDHTVFILLDMNSLPEEMFYLCQKVKEIYFSSLFNNIEIKSMYRMFFGCTALTSIDFTNFKIKNATTLENMFNGCSSLKNINISNIDISKVTSMNAMFSGCKELEMIEFPNIKTKELKFIEGMFLGCSSLTSLDLSNFDTKQISSFSNLFNECNSLTSLNISNFDTTNVIKMENMFKNCFSLISLDLSNFDTINLQNMNGIFYGCSKFTSLNFSNFNTQNVTYINYMFEGCSSLTSIDLSNFMLEKQATNVNNMFYGCLNLTYIDISYFTFPSNSNPFLFDKDIPPNGTIIVKNETVGNMIKKQIPNWEIKYIF